MLAKIMRNFKTKHHGEDQIKVTFIVDGDTEGPRGRICFIPLTEFSKSLTVANKAANRTVIIDWINANKSKCYPIEPLVNSLTSKDTSDTINLTNW